MRILHNLVWMVGYVVAASAAVAAEPPTIANLIQALKAGETAGRLEAIDRLGSLGEKAADAVPSLVPLLQDTAPMVRAHSARSLGEIGPKAEAAVPALAKLVLDPDKSVRSETVAALGAIHGDPQVTIPLLVQALRDVEPSVRVRALKSLVEMGPAAAVSLAKLLDDDELEYWAELGLAELGSAATEAIPALIHEIQDEHPESRREAILALAVLGPKAETAVGPLTQALDDPAIHGAAAYALGRIGPAAAPARTKLESLSTSPEPLLQTVSVWALARIYPEDQARRDQAVQLLAKALAHPQQRVREAAARALAELKPGAQVVLPAIREAFTSADPAQVQDALEALASLGEAAVPGLINALQIKSPQAQARAACVLGEIGPAAASAVSALAPLLHSEDADVRREVIFALAKIGPAAVAAVPELLQSFQSGPVESRYGAAYALGNIGPGASAAKPALLAGLREQDRFLALVSAWALAHVDPNGDDSSAQAVPLLTAALQDSESKVRSQAASALGCFGPRAKTAVPALNQASQDEDPLVRESVAQALKAIGQ